MNNSNYIQICPSKSDAERAIICSYLTEIQNLNENKTFEEASISADSRVSNEGISEDVLSIKECMKKILLHEFESSNNRIKECEVLELNSGQSAANLRFLIPICAALGINAIIRYEGRHRSIMPLKEELRKKGIKIEELDEKVKVSGKILGGTFEIPGDISSQFISGLMLSLPLTDEGGKIIVKGRLESLGYVNMTVASLRKSNIDIKESRSEFEIMGRQRYQAPPHYSVEGDWSNAAVWIALNLILSISEGKNGEFKKEVLLKHPIEIKGLDYNSIQPDKDILNILMRFIDVDMNGNLALKGDNVIDASNNPDLVPVIAAIAGITKGTTLITNASRLRLKESNRIETICDVLFNLGIDIEETSDGLIIYGIKKLRGAKIRSYDDHRIVMMAALMSQLCPSTVVIENSQAINKSYPEFKNELRKFNLDTNIEWR